MSAVDPFFLSAYAEKLTDIYPDSSNLKDTYINTTRLERLGIIRLWVTEGIPFAFKDNPLLYEGIRGFIAEGLGIATKEVTLVGSARTGYSLSKNEWGRPFNTNSDFDFAVISDSLYRHIVADFNKWAGDISSRKIIPRDSEEMSRWLYNIEYLDKRIRYGFIQVKFIPNDARYPTVKRCYDTVRVLKKKLSCSVLAPHIADASVRVYSSWKSCIRQLRINFNVALNLWNG